jgi:hypothetical protein
MPILCGLSRLNMYSPDVPLYTPSEIVPTAHLRPIVGAKKLWCPPQVDDSLQHSCHGAARHTGVGF